MSIIRTYNDFLYILKIQYIDIQAPENYGGLHTFQVRGDCQTTILTKGTNTALTVRQFTASNPVVFQVMGDGRTYIGEKRVSGQHADALLQVDGKVACKSFYVLKPTTWADNVFKSKTNVDLNELYEFIQKNKHLPGIPSEEEIIKNGYDINDMNARLLSKIEELYLIIFEQNMKIKCLEEKIK